MAEYDAQVVGFIGARIEDRDGLGAASKIPLLYVAPELQRSGIGRRLVHEAAEWLLGHPVWTHEFIIPEIKQALIDEVLRQFPDMPTEKPEDWATCRLSLHSAYGDTVAVERGNRERTVDPVTSAIDLKESLSLATGERK